MAFISLNDYIVPYIDDRMIVRDNNKKLKNTFNSSPFIKEHLYQIKKEECDGFETEDKTYQFKGVIDELNGIKIDSVIMKQVSGQKSTIFSLTKFDCRNIGLTFENGLQLFPKNMEWVDVTPQSHQNEEIKEENTFVITNLSTYPRCSIDETIRTIMFKLHGCTNLGTRIMLPNKKTIIKKENFLDSLVIKRLPLLNGFSNDCAIKTHLFGINCPKEDIIDVNGDIFIELHLVQKNPYSHDRLIGINPQWLKGSWKRYFNFGYDVSFHTSNKVTFNDTIFNLNFEKISKHPSFARSMIDFDNLSRTMDDMSATIDYLFKGL